MSLLTLHDLPLEGKKIFMRVDFNVPMEKGAITDASRIIASLPSINFVLEKGGALILMSHLGRPKGKKDEALSLRPCAEKLSELIGKKVIMASDCIGSDVERLVKELQPGQVLMLENLRFHAGEEKPNEDPAFVQELAKSGDFYVNDAFGTAHRFHASTAAIAAFFPDRSAAGFLMEKEINFLGETLKNPSRPFLAIVGGAKISTKLGTLSALLKRADSLFVGGAMAFTFFKALGYRIGDSLYEEDQVDKAATLLEESAKLRIPLLLPPDLLIANSLSEEAETALIKTSEGIPEGWRGVDAGPQTIQKITEELSQAKTVFWNGPLGVFEIKKFSKGTMEVAKAVSESAALTIVGGGDSLAAVQASGVSEKITHLSTGGGAALEYIELGSLPGIEALSHKSGPNN